MRKSSSHHLYKYKTCFHDNSMPAKALFLASLFLCFIIPIDAKASCTEANLIPTNPCLPNIDGGGGISDILKGGAKKVEQLERGTIGWVEQAGGDTIRTTVTAVNNVTATYTKAWADGMEQAKRSFQDAVDAAKAVGNYAANQAKDLDQAVKNAAKRFQEGKPIDAVWGLSTEPLQGAEKNLFQATQESSLVKDTVQTTASAYGPGGAAAYTAWATYHSTGDADLALRAGIESAVQNQTGSALTGTALMNKMPSGTAGELLKKSAMAGALGGIAVAAAGGDGQAVKDAFLKSSGAVLIQGSTDKFKAFSPKAKDALDMLHCISAKDVDCISNTTYMRETKDKIKGRILFDNNGNPRIDPQKLDPQQNIGRWTTIDPNSHEGQTLAFISKMSKLPKVEAIPLKKNQWVLTWTLGRDQTLVYGEPAVVLTYVGTDAPFISTVEYESFITDSVYSCPVSGFIRTVTTTKSQNSCKTIYRKEGEITQLIWHAHNDSESCAAKAAAFITHLSNRGTSCSPVSEAGVTPMPEEDTVRVTGTVGGKEIVPNRIPNESRPVVPIPVDPIK